MTSILEEGDYLIDDYVIDECLEDDGIEGYIHVTIS